MPVISVSLLLQIGLTIHALKTGRDYYWAFIIMFIPGIGALAYFLVELLPELQHGRTGAKAKKFSRDMARNINPAKHIKKLEEDLAVADSLENRKRLASAYLQNGRPKDALDLYERCLGGIFSQDPDLMLEVAQAHFMVGDCEKSTEFLSKIPANVVEKLRTQKDYLLARIADETGREEEALERWTALLNIWPGEEARCRLAYYLDRRGDPEKAKALYRDVLLNARRSPGYYRKNERQWIRIAKGELAKTQNK